MFVANDNHGTQANGNGLEVMGFGNFGFVKQKHPLGAENFYHFRLEQPLIGEKRAMDQAVRAN